MIRFHCRTLDILEKYYDDNINNIIIWVIPVFAGILYPQHYQFTKFIIN